MYALFWEKDLEIIEINPLGINFDGEVMALDGKIRVNDYALSRHPSLLELIGEHLEQKNTVISSAEVNFNLNPQGNIAVISNNLDLGLLTNNLILEKKGNIGAFFLLEKYEQLSLSQQLAVIFEKIFSSDKLKFILVNILASDALNQEIVEAITNFYQRELNSQVNKGEERMERLTGSKSRLRRSPQSKSTVKKIKSRKQIQWVLRIVSTNIEQTLNTSTELPIQFTTSLEEAIEIITNN
jgi:succinyl-CoA synthetase beta subunit